MASSHLCKNRLLFGSLFFLTLKQNGKYMALEIDNVEQSWPSECSTCVYSYDLNMIGCVAIGMVSIT